MNRCLHAVACALGAIAVAVSPASAPEEEAALVDEIIVEDTFDLRLELPKESAVQTMIDWLTLRAETERALDLQIANRTPLTTILDLTKYVPIPLFGTSSRLDTFFQENYMRADLNPREDKALFER